MTSPSRETRRPIKRITLDVKVEGDRSELAQLKKSLPGAKHSKGTLLVSIDTAEPQKVIEKLKSLGEAIREAEKNPKGFK